MKYTLMCDGRRNSGCPDVVVQGEQEGRIMKVHETTFEGG